MLRLPTKRPTPIHLYVATIVALLLVQPSEATADAARRPNVIVFFADDLGYEGLSCNGAVDYRTPVLDELAATGVRFRHAHAQPICTPSRVKLMTGKSNLRNYTRFGQLDPTQTTIGNVLKDAGYATAIAGKWQLGGDEEQLQRFGFDEHCLWHFDGRQSRFWEPRVFENGKLLSGLDESFGPDVFEKFISRFIRAKKDEPFFVYFPMALTHWPFVPTPDSPPGGSRERSGRYDGRPGGTEYFDDMIAYMDKVIGRIVKTVDDVGVRDRTLLMFTGDNGTAINIRSRLREGETIRAVQGGKGSMTDAGTRVPFVVNWPGQIQKGLVSDALIDLSDILPTVADACGVSLARAQGFDGQSFLPQLRGESKGQREWIVCDYNPRPPKPNKDPGKNATRFKKQRAAKQLGRFVRNQRYKLYDDGRFFDVATDVYEQRDLSATPLSVEAAAARDKFRAVHKTFPAFRPYGRPPQWKKHVVWEGAHCNAAIAADFNRDGLTDVVSNAGGVTRLHLAKRGKKGLNYKTVVEIDTEKLNMIHAEVFDVDRDGDPDFIGTRYQPGFIVWYETPSDVRQGPWKRHVIDNKVIGIHGLLKGDVNRDGRLDLLANSAQPRGDFPNSLVWLETPSDPTKPWTRHVFAQGDAPGLSHYLGFGDVDGDGRPDAASGAKGGPGAKPLGSGDWFAWWKAPEDPTKAWKKTRIGGKQLGATNIHPADINGDGVTDFIASRGHGRGVTTFVGPDWRESVIHPNLKGPHCLVVQDLDLDGDIDAATCAKDDQMAVWFENDGRGRFTSHLVGNKQSAYDIRATDMDGDGDPDLLIAGQTSQNVVWFENPVTESKTQTAPKPRKIRRN
ncbi:MAG: sulfatase-like hydrolase/transferase [Planctomycetota bacterium]